jgi:hypothetical protein
MIGRQSNCDVTINDRQVSPQHARISWQNGRFVVTDLGSLNGTTINGRPLTGSFPLRDGDTIGLGSVSLVFEVLRSVSSASVGPVRSRDAEAADTSESGDAANGDDSPQQKKWPLLAGGACTCLVIAACVIAIAAVVGLRMVPSMQAAPEVRVLEPAAGAQVRAGQPVNIVATARGTAGVVKAEVWIDGKLNATITSDKPGGQPILRVDQPWVPASGGPHTIEIKAYSPSGRASEPVQLALTAVDQPTVVAAAPTPAPTPTFTPVIKPAPPKVEAPTNTPAPADCNANDAAFVADVSVPDHSPFGRGAAFNKTWRVRNSGACAWDASYKLVFVSGSQMGGPDSQPIAATAAGGSVDVTVPMQAPGQYGTYSGIWQMANAKGEPFGQNLSVVIVVPSPATPTPPPPPPPPTQPPAPAVSSSLTADKDTVNSGECTTLHATANGVAAAWLEGAAIAGGKMDKQVCPCGETTYTLDTQLTSGEHQKYTKTIKVNNPTCGSGSGGPISVRDVSVDNSDSIKVGEKAKIKVRFKNTSDNDEDGFDVDVTVIPLNDAEPTDLPTQHVGGLAAGKDQTLSWDYTFKDYVTYTLRGKAKDNQKEVQFKPHKG